MWGTGARAQWPAIYDAQPGGQSVVAPANFNTGAT